MNHSLRDRAKNTRPKGKAPTVVRTRDLKMMDILVCKKLQSYALPTELPMLLLTVTALVATSFHPIFEGLGIKVPV